MHENVSLSDGTVLDLCLACGSSCCWFNVLLKKKVVRPSTQTTTFSLLETRFNASITRTCCSYRQPMCSQTTSSLLAPCHSVARNGGHSGENITTVSVKSFGSTNFLQQCIVKWQHVQGFLFDETKKKHHSFIRCHAMLASKVSRNVGLSCCRDSPGSHLCQAAAQMWSRNM